MLHAERQTCFYGADRNTTGNSIMSIQMMSDFVAMSMHVATLVSVLAFVPAVAVLVLATALTDRPA
jgi:hypothetical protein